MADRMRITDNQKSPSRTYGIHCGDEPQRWARGERQEIRGERLANPGNLRKAQERRWCHMRIKPR
jgi:hypothetical protein